jgi:Flp pilus assembly protein CpaB
MPARPPRPVAPYRRRIDTPAATSGATGDEVDVLVAKETLNAGALGDELIAAGKVGIERIPLSEKASDALVAPSHLSNRRLTLTFAAGEQITERGLTVASQLSQAVTIPPGFEAVAITTDFVGGGAGYIAPGDVINVFAFIPEVSATAGALDDTSVTDALAYGSPRAELLLTNVRVLDVQNSAAAAAAAARPEVDSLTLLVAVDTIDAEKLIFTASANRIYVSRVAEDAAPAGPTPGRDYTTLFDEEPNAAFNRSGTATPS